MIDFADVESIVTLLGEIAGIDENVSVRRRLLLERLAEFVKADIWAWVHLRVPQKGMAVGFQSLDGGYAYEAERAESLKAANHPTGNLIPMALARMSCGEKITITVKMSDDPDSNPHFQPFSAAELTHHRQFFQQYGFGDQLLSHYPLDESTVSLIGLHRRVGRPNFTTREKTIVHLIVGQLGWLHRFGSSVPANDDFLLDLTPRVRQLLLLELDGISRKSMAELCKISPLTVRDHFQSIYRKLGVSSRVELFTLFLESPSKNGHNGR